MSATERAAAGLSTRGSEPASTSEQPESRVIYLGHLPHGFYEDELRAFFTQFGQVTRLRVSRNKKTGKAKNYAFLEFKSSEVAAIAAEAMDGYFLFKQKLVCHVLATQDQHEDLFKGANRKFAKIPWQRMEAERHNKLKTPAEQDKHRQRALRHDGQRRKRIRAAGIDYELEPLEAQLEKRPKHTTFSAEDSQAPA